MATGEDIFSLSFTIPQTQAPEDEQEDLYRPTMDEEEGSGDSEDDMFGANPVPSTRATDELASIGLTTSTPSNVGGKLGGQGKRKIGEKFVQRKKQKVPTSKQIVDVVSVIANASKDRVTTLDAIKDVSVDTAMNQLLDLDEVVRDEDFRRYRCVKLLMEKTSWETFVSLRKRNTEFVVPVYGYITPRCT